MERIPVTPAKNFQETLHKVVIDDPYHWLEGDDKRVSKWIDGQNNFAHSILSKLTQRKEFAKRFMQLLKTDSIGVPYPVGKFY